MAVRAFIVEDNSAIRESLVEALAELAGIRTVGQSGNAAGAIAWLTQSGNDWDVAIVDLLLDETGTGLDVLKALRGREPGRQVVVLTATASGLVRDQCLALGCDEVFDKSMDTEALLDWCMRRAGRPAGPVVR
ncbi:MULTISPECIES: response regulator [Ramlibacter]|uniref:response regulator n=1 Tax=Ramlibacter TaxID=174951 RepID=UPI0012FB6A1D|nr:MULTISPECIES: response regulator [Ramlibacter]MBA2963913.1 response regulator [Ramlibacter sp. CGMCC 1.13660]